MSDLVVLIKNKRTGWYIIIVFKVLALLCSRTDMNVNKLVKTLSITLTEGCVILFISVIFITVWEQMLIVYGVLVIALNETKAAALTLYSSRPGHLQNKSNRSLRRP